MTRDRTPPMFPAPAARLADIHITLPAGKATWKRMKPTAKGRCDVCMAAYAAHQKDPKTVPYPPMSRPPRYRRTQRGARELLVCAEHKAEME